MKLWERFIERRIRQKVEIRDNQFGFKLGKLTTKAISCFKEVNREI